MTLHLQLMPAIWDRIKTVQEAVDRVGRHPSLVNVVRTHSEERLKVVLVPGRLTQLEYKSIYLPYYNLAVLPYQTNFASIP